MNSIEFIYLRKTVLFIVVLILLSASLTATGYYVLEEKRDNLTALEANLTKLTIRVDEALEAQKAITGYRSLYEKISAEGFLSTEQRLLWVERLESSANNLHLTALRYTVSPQIEKQIGDSITLNQSDMEINVELLHEEDLIYLLKELAKPPAGLLTVEKCQLQYQPELKVSTLSNSLKSKCLLSWYTAKESDQPDDADETDPALEGI